MSLESRHEFVAGLAYVLQLAFFAGDTVDNVAAFTRHCVFGDVFSSCVGAGDLPTLIEYRAVSARRGMTLSLGYVLVFGSPLRGCL